MDRFKKCLICNSNDLSILKGYEKNHLCKCGNCGFVFSQKIPLHTELLNEYSKYPRDDLISKITLKRYDDLLNFFQKYRIQNNIIDIGAGNGHFIAKAKEAGWNSYATEFDDRAVELCRQKGVTVHKGKLDLSNYQENYFDVIYSSEVIEHINNPVEEIQNYNKILRKEGLNYITTPNLNSISHKLTGNK